MTLYLSPLVSALLGALLAGAISLSGLIIIWHKKILTEQLTIYLVAGATGAMLGGAFFHLLPEALEVQEALSVFVNFTAGFLFFLLLEKILHWHHCQQQTLEKTSEHKQLGYLSLIGDGFHNLIDGMVIYAAFVSGPTLGWTTLLAVIAHEIPQELGDFGILLYAGFSRQRALWFNFLSALSAIVGVILSYWLSQEIQLLETYLLGFAAGGFVYIAGTDLLPEVKKTSASQRQGLVKIIILILSLTLLFGLKIIFESGH